MKKDACRFKVFINFYRELMENDMYLDKIFKFNVRKIKFIIFQRDKLLKRKKNQTVAKISHMQSGNFRQEKIVCTETG